ncbi:D-malate dehydrogenase [decarboxylating] [Arthrobacter sp. Bi83]|uniref:isocitrate/isopropylmalate family dehydrogenase n=1 Tax=Arthrobacter sp. Bi83 TaxID=2822353 RepID=UPI001D89A7F6|nr:isocitrate/isopropylmalate family dehydrogenase [Arthrobacter sp. Bi83]CAH0301616.1 D-malate dehydrogenase [decarboxylating] [Arthrobacter sp. Bi83]
MSKSHRIAVIPGDGSGTEVVPEGLRVLNAAASAFDLNLKYEHFDYASADYYTRHGQMLPDGWFDELNQFDSIFFGAVGWPDVVPDHISLWGSLLQFRRHFDQYVSLRPVKLLPGVPSPLAGRVPGDVDFYVVRENTEGEYSSIGGKIFEGTDRETVVQETVMTRTGVDRILKYAFDLAQSRPKKHLTSATKSNGIPSPCPTGTNASRKWPRTSVTSTLISTTSTSWPLTSSCTPAAITTAMETVLAHGQQALTPDMGGNATTKDLGKAVAAALTTP